MAFREHGAWHDLHGDDLNEALRRLSGTDVTAKDFRTWHATVLAAVAEPWQPTTTRRGAVPGPASPA
jgi:DNA topoisomerase IB